MRVRFIAWPIPALRGVAGVFARHTPGLRELVFDAAAVMQARVRPGGRQANAYVRHDVAVNRGADLQVEAAVLLCRRASVEVRESFEADHEVVHVVIHFGDEAGEVRRMRRLGELAVRSMHAHELEQNRIHRLRVHLGRTKQRNEHGGARRFLILVIK